MLKIKFKGLLRENFKPEFKAMGKLKLGHKVDKLADRLPKDMYVDKRWVNNQLVFMLLQKLEGGRIKQYGTLKITDVDVMDDLAYVVQRAGVEGGYGPLLYELALEHASKETLGLKPDQNIVSSEANAVWDIYNVRDDIESTQLDYHKEDFDDDAEEEIPSFDFDSSNPSDYVRQLTPNNPEDDYFLGSAMKNTGAYDYLMSDDKKLNGFDKWMDSSLTKIYRKNNDNITRKLREKGQLVEKTREYQ